MKVAIVVSQSVVVGHHRWIKPRSDNDHRAIPSNQATNSGDLVVITTGQMPRRWLKPLITIGFQPMVITMVIVNEDQNGVGGSYPNMMMFLHVFLNPKC
jgi:hypothetical protein